MGAWFMRGLLFLCFFGGNACIALFTIYGGWRVAEIIGYDMKTIIIMSSAALLIVGTVYSARIFLRVCDPGVVQNALALGTRIAWVAITFTLVREFVQTSTGDLFVLALLVYALLALANVPMLIAEAMLCFSKNRQWWNARLAELDQESAAPGH